METKEETRHSPGPWKIESEPHLVWDARGMVVVNLMPRWIDDENKYETIASNARLIAAAPDGLALANMIVRIPMSVPKHVVDAAKALIAKAEGDSPMNAETLTRDDAALILLAFGDDPSDRAKARLFWNLRRTPEPKPETENDDDNEAHD